MDVEIINQPLKLTVYGFGGVAQNGDYAGTAFKLMDKMWQVVKVEGLKTKGQNIWVYEPGEHVFAGVEIDGEVNAGSKLENKEVVLSKYAYYKYIGPYSRIKEAGNNMKARIKSMGLQTGLPYIEIYGHWQSDETKLETELIMALE